MIIIINEWILHDLKGDNGEERKRRAEKFLLKILEKCDKIAVGENSPFVKKLWKFSKHFESRTIRILKNAFLLNSQKTIYFSQKELETQSSKHKIPEKVKQDDVYLLELYNLVKEENRVILTSDTKLAQTIGEAGYNVELEDDFLKRYLEE